MNIGMNTGILMATIIITIMTMAMDTSTPMRMITATTMRTGTNTAMSTRRAFTIQRMPPNSTSAGYPGCAPRSRTS